MYYSINIILKQINGWHNNNNNNNNNILKLSLDLWCDSCRGKKEGVVVSTWFIRCHSWVKWSHIWNGGWSKGTSDYSSWTCFWRWWNLFGKWWMFDKTRINFGLWCLFEEEFHSSTINKLLPLKPPIHRSKYIYCLFGMTITFWYSKLCHRKKENTQNTALYRPGILHLKIISMI